MTDIRMQTPVIDVQEIWANIKYTDAQYNRFKFIHSEERNIVLIGRSRTGKTTVARVIEDIFHFSTERSLYSETKTVEFHKATTGSPDGRRYFFNIIDVPGFFDISTNPNEVITNAQVKDFIINCISKNVCNIHVFAYAFSLSAGINEQDIESMVYTKKCFPNLSSNMALIITCCERCSEEECQKLADDFFKEPRVKENNLKDFFKQGVFFMGCLRRESHEQKNTAGIQEEYNNVLRMRNIWIQKCIDSDQPFNIHKANTGCNIL